MSDNSNRHIRNQLVEVRCKCGQLIFKVWSEPVIVEGVCRRCKGKTMLIRDITAGGELEEDILYFPKKKEKTK